MTRNKKEEEEFARGKKKGDFKREREEEKIGSKRCAYFDICFRIVSFIMFYNIIKIFGD